MLDVNAAEESTSLWKTAVGHVWLGCEKPTLSLGPARAPDTAALDSRNQLQYSRRLTTDGLSDYMLACAVDWFITSADIAKASALI